MARRSPYNARYKKDTAPKGVTRKSASSAKPSRDVGDKPKATASKKTNVPIKYQTPDTAEFKNLRQQWWIVLVVAIVLLVVSLVITMPQFAKYFGGNAQIISLAMSWIALGLVAYSWYLDLRKIRPMTKAYQAGLKAGNIKPKKSSAAAEPAYAEQGEDESETTD